MAEVLPLIRFKAIEYSSRQDSILNRCLNTFKNKLIVRSSSQNEDTLTESNSGRFDSVLNVELDKNSIDKAIMQVIKSYEIMTDYDEVFIQPMLNNVTMSGVIFTADIDSLTPYYIINYDTSGSTTSVTEGSCNNLNTFIA